MRNIITILLASLVVSTCFAIPARKGAFIYTTADGVEQEVYLHGDEFFHYLTDSEGNWLDESTLLPLTNEEQSLRRSQGQRRAQARRAKQAQSIERLLASKGIIILVSYSDESFQSSLSDMKDWAMGNQYTYNGATGSVRQYFLDQSWGSYDMQIDVYGPVTVSKEASYYGKNDRYGNDLHADELVVEACKLAAAQGADFSQYDSNNDGYVDWVVVLYAGRGEADGGSESTIWPHQWDLSETNKTFKLNGKTINHYCCLNEIDSESNKRCGIGTFCHEFSHIMGLPDLYETNYNPTGVHTLMEWDVMDYGPYNNNGNTPPAYSAYERWFMGWLQPTLVNSAISVTLPDINSSKAAVLMTETGQNVTDILNPNPNTFYLFENRQKIGWDRYLPGNGMLITKIKFNYNDWYYNEVNNSSSNMGVDLMEARTNTSNYGKSNDAYPAGSTSFTKNTNYTVTNISLTDGIIHFDVNGGGQSLVLGLEDIEYCESTQKILLDGQLYIIRNDVIYDLSGRIVQF